MFFVTLLYVQRVGFVKLMLYIFEIVFEYLYCGKQFLFSRTLNS